MYNYTVAQTFINIASTNGKARKHISLSKSGGFLPPSYPAMRFFKRVGNFYYPPITSYIAILTKYTGNEISIFPQTRDYSEQLMSILEAFQQDYSAVDACLIYLGIEREDFPCIESSVPRTLHL